MKLELGDKPAEGGETPKEPASSEKPTSSDPDPKKDKPKPKEETPPPPKPEKEAPPPSPKPSDTKKSEPKPSEPKKTEPKSQAAESPFGNREERRVCISDGVETTSDSFLGQDEPNASEDRREVEAVAKYCGFADNIQRGRYVLADGIPEIVQG